LIKITSGGKDVIYAGTIAAYNGEPIEVTLSDDQDPMHLDFVLIKDPNDEDSNYTQLQLVDETKLLIRFVNYRSGRFGTKEALLLGEFAKKSLEIQYSVEYFPDRNDQWFMNLTIYSGREINNE